jgi:hypothetical protein
LQDVTSALEKAAKDDMRPVSHLVQKIVADWLKERQYLKWENSAPCDLTKKG